MPIDFLRISSLISKYYNDGLNPAEKAELDDWIGLSDQNRQLFESFSDQEHISETLRHLQSLDSEAEWNKLEQLFFDRPAASIIELNPSGGMSVTAKEAPRKPPVKWIRAVALAACLAAVSAGVWLWLRVNHEPKRPVILASAPVHDIAPGGNKAILTLANGSTIVLDSAANGTIARQGTTKIEKTGNGRLSYNVLHERSDQVEYNTLTTPPAGQYQVRLPDGTQVWLNNASSITYPTSFTGKSREVELNGEAFFEVARNESMPFTVKVKKMTVEVLGTSMNIMAYADEGAVKTTLLTGRVRVSEGSVNAVLRPDQQAQVNGDGKFRVIDSVNTDGVVAWKNGFFHFDHAGTQDVMRQLARWYDIKVIYDGAIPVRDFAGGIGRNLKLSEVFDILKANNIKFTVVDRTVTVMPGSPDK